MKIIRLLLFVTLVLATFLTLQSYLSPVPPLGPFFNPFGGFWQNGEDPEPPEQLQIPGLKSEVRVAWDDRRVPHIFAANDDDLYFAQGYLTARDRLWQMEIQVMAAAGRLAEILGPSLIEEDRFQRRIGVARAAALAAGAMTEVKSTRPVVHAYADGVNAYIVSLGDADLPLEYKLLDYRPELWSPLKTALLLKQMAWDLTAYNHNELHLTRARELLGDSLVNKLYPVRPPYSDPIIPPGTEWPFEAPKLPPEEVSDAGMTLEVERVFSTVSGFADAALGSNNWAVAGSKTASGAPILCSDPHLGLSLPSVWYEMQLHSPTVNVYGVTMPGAPGVVIGFNESIAWGLTNAETDVIDLYEIAFVDSSCSEYIFDGNPRPVEWRIDTILVRDAEPVIDSVCLTHCGPVVFRPGEEQIDRRFSPGTALKWIGGQASQKLLAFLRLNRAQDFDQYRDALQYYGAPAQNFVFASASGDIAICHNGTIPVRQQGQGRYIADGSSAASAWHDYIPREHLPLVRNPARGYLSSANQYPVDSLYPYYLPGTHYTFERGARINEVLDRLTEITPEMMMALQTDLVNLHARMVLPTLLGLLENDSLNQLQMELADTLRQWDYRDQAELIAPSIFATWWSDLSRLIWEDDLQIPKGRLDLPRRDVTMQLILEEPESRFFDDSETDARESLSDLVQRSFAEAVSGLVDRYGEPDSSWQWGQYRGTNIMHLARLPELSHPDLPVNGSPATVNASSSVHGVSWRMVVELSNPPRAWGIYPGGQSGNPGSENYDHMIPDWLVGDYYPLIFLSEPDSSVEGIVSTSILRGER